MSDDFNNLSGPETNEKQADQSSKSRSKDNKPRNKLDIKALIPWLGRRTDKNDQKENSAFSDIKKAFIHIKPSKVVLGLAASLIGIYLLTGIYIVNPGEQAVIRRFGVLQPQPVSEGIHYRLPSPIDEVQKVNVSEVRRADVGMNLPEHMHQENDVPQPIQLLTGDENIITTQAIVHYKVKDAAKFLYNVDGNSEQLVRNSVESSMIKLMSNVAVDNILGSEKVQAQTSIMQLTQETLDLYDAGIQITAFNIQAIVPPETVADAFRNVTTAREEKETAINEANGYYNSQIPNARAEANTMVSQAEAYKTEQINKATGEAQKFQSMLQEYQNNSQIYSEDTTKYRLLLETLEKILPKVKKYIVDSSDGSVDVKMFDPSLMQGVINNTSGYDLDSPPN